MKLFAALKNRRWQLFSGFVLLLASALCFHPHTRPYVRLAMRQIMPAALTLPYTPPPSPQDWKNLSAAQRLADVQKRLKAPLDAALKQKNLRSGQEAYIRIFKESGEFELWLKNSAGAWKRWRNYPIAFFSGELGPKQKEGDMQAPEGCYDVTRQRLNPASNYHLAFNLGYPNALDRHHGRTGSLIMVHGRQVSIGCFAMTDPLIEEIYLLTAAALEGGQSSVPVHVFPFRMTEKRLQQAAAENQPWLAFWKDLRAVHDAFEHTQQPPQVLIHDGRYKVK